MTLDPNAGRFSPLAELESAPADTLDLIVANRFRFLVPVRQPLLLITQIQRSGGTLTSQLFDGHRQIHMHPSELHIGKPKYVWPSIDLTAGSTAIFARLSEPNALAHARSGYLKLSGAELARNKDHRKLILPFIFIGALQKRLFVQLMEKYPPANQREALDHYATSYFNAWLDYAGLYRDPATVKYWCAFVAMFLRHPDSANRFFTDYPDGAMIVPIRDPASWYASAVRHNPKGFGDPERAVEAWITCNTNAIAVAKAHPGRICFVPFENLVSNTASTIAGVCGRLGLTFDAAATLPTFNGMPIVSDSSFGAKFGLDETALHREHFLDHETYERIRCRTAKIWDTLMEAAQPPPCAA